MIQLTTLAVAGSVGVWLFYVQHQFEHAYWERRENWDYAAAALKGSSFYQLPKVRQHYSTASTLAGVLQWFSGNIGFHHVHHLSPRIPNYNLERCHRSDPMFRDVPSVRPLASLKLMTLRLWDESTQKLVGFRRLREIRRQRTRDPRAGETVAGGDAEGGKLE